MGVLLAIITPIAVFDMAMVLPSHSVFLLMQLGASRPIVRALLYVFGFFLASFGAGVLVAIGLEQLIDFIDLIIFEVIFNPSPFDYVLQLGIALAMLYVSYRLYCGMRQKPVEQAKDPSPKPRISDRFQGLGPLGGFLLGFSLSLAGIPSALTYFAAIDQMVKADVGISGIAIAIGFYNFIVVIPFLIFILIAMFAPDRGQQMIQRASQFAGLWGQRVVFALITVLAIVLLFDSIGYFLGSPIIPVPQSYA